MCEPHLPYGSYQPSSSSFSLSGTKCWACVAPEREHVSVACNACPRRAFKGTDTQGTTTMLCNFLSRGRHLHQGTPFHKAAHGLGSMLASDLCSKSGNSDQRYRNSRLAARASDRIAACSSNAGEAAFVCEQRGGSYMDRKEGRSILCHHTGWELGVQTGRRHVCRCLLNQKAVESPTAHTICTVHKLGKTSSTRVHLQ